MRLGFALQIGIVCLAAAGLSQLAAAGQAPLPRWHRAPYAYPAQEMLEVSPTTLGACMATVAVMQGSRLKFDTSKMNEKYDSTEFFKYLTTFRGFKTFRTGREPALKEWVLAQPDNSISPLSLFRKSLELNHGNLWNAVLANYRLLHANSRWWNADVIERYASSNEEQSRFFNKFIDIRGDLHDRGEGFYGEQGATWYRIWGLMLYRMMQENDSQWNEIIGGASDWTDRFGQEWSDSKTDSMAVAAEAAKLLQPSTEDDWRKADINLAAGNAMSAMIRALAFRTQGSLPSLRECENPSTYVIPSRVLIQQLPPVYYVPSIY